METFLKYCCTLIMLSTMLSCKTSAKNDDVVLSIPSHPLAGSANLDLLMEQIGDSRIVLLGEASHGTAEYYNWRAEISKRLIAEKGFGFIAVEGEWADSYRVNQFIKGEAKDSLQALEVLSNYNRWPTWMWGNYEIASLVTWLNKHNQSKPAPKKAGFYGLDVYCLWESMQELMPLIQGNDSLMRMANEVRGCFQPFSADPIQYAYSVANSSDNCRAQTRQLYQAIMNYTGGKTASSEAAFLMQQNSLVALNGENYYRTAASSNNASWNVRDRHMSQTLQRLLDFHGPDSKVIVWEHNTHVGDARYTDMAAAGMVNVGQLVRELYGRENVFIVGFGSHSGSVIAADEWGAPFRSMKVPSAKRGSWEDMLHRNGPTDKILLSSELRKLPALMKPLGHRAIGVQYDPSKEAGNYVPTVIPDRYDAFIFLDKTSALRPLETAVANEPPDTYPSGY